MNSSRRPPDGPEDRRALPSDPRGRRRIGRRLIAATSATALAGSMLAVSAAPAAAAVTDPNPSFRVIASDLEFILDQIQIAESHASGRDLLCPDLPGQPGSGRLDTSGTCVPDPRLPWGLRTVDGQHNNLINPDYGSADQNFPRLLPRQFRAAEAGSHYVQPAGMVVDSAPRVISNLIVDQTTANPAAAAVAAKVEGSETIGSRFFIPNEAPDEGLSAPFNTWFIFFGQFFDHGLDLVSKGDSGTVMVPLRADDPLFDPNLDGPDGLPGTGDEPANALFLTRATNGAGPDGVLGTGDDVRQHNNKTTPFVDQNQTYTSHPSHQVFLREYNPDGSATGALLDAPTGGLATWADLKAQAASVLGVQLDDSDVHNVPLLLTDPYGNFVPGPTGKVQFALDGGGYVEADDGGSGTGVPVPANALRTGHAFLDDIAHAAAPSTDPTNDAHDAVLLGKHFVTGDGRGNENIALTAVHHVFHAEHNRVLGQIEDVLADNPALQDRYESEAAAAGIPVWSLGQRLFQAARFVTEMEYQHLVFEEFARFIQPAIDPAPFNESTYHTDVNAAIVAEFAHVVYRFGHSQLTETIDRVGAPDIPLLDGFLNPDAFTVNGALSPDEAAGAIASGTVQQPGNAIDEFVTETLRNQLLGLPLDLATINLARGRDAGVPPLQEARRTFFAATGDVELKPYTSWNDFGANMKNPESLVNFIAAYGTHPSITGVSDAAGKRAAAQALLDSDDPFLTQDAATSGVDDIDFWMGGLAEAGIPFGGMLGTTFNVVFERQLENLQNGDRFYYLNRNIGLNLFHQLEANSFSALIQRTTAATNLPAEVFTAPDVFFDVDTVDPGAVPAGFANECTAATGDVYPASSSWRFYGGEHISMHGSDQPDCLRGGIGDDSLWGYGGNDHLTGGPGVNSLVGGDGDDILHALAGDDNVKGGAGNDVIHAGTGLDLILAGSGNDYVLHGSDNTTSFAGLGNDLVRGGPAADILTGNEGDDWLEGAGGADLVQGDNANGFQNDPNGGDEVMIGGAGNNDLDSEGGNDIMLSGPGSERFEGMLGFDLVTHKGQNERAYADMANTVFQPPTTGNFRDRFDLVEGVSGWNYDDVLRGVDLRDENDGAGHELTEAYLDKVVGLRALLSSDGVDAVYAVPFMTTSTTNNLLLGGRGSDVMEGRGGDDFIDGSAWLDVYIEWRGPNGEVLERADGMEAFQARVLSRQINPADLHIVREIVRATEPGGTVNTAVFTEGIDNYTITPVDSATTTLLIAHTGGAATDGTDTVRHVEMLDFAGTLVPVSSFFNSPVTGEAVLSTLSPVEDQQVTVDTSGIADGDGLGAFTFQWQASSDGGVTWTDVGTDSDGFTPGQNRVGQVLQVVVSFTDGEGNDESVTSAVTAPVANANDAPTGVPTIDDTSPTVGQLLTADAGGIADADGLGAITLTWQSSADAGSTWSDVGSGQTHAPATAGVVLRVVASYTDGQGTPETVPSAATAAVAEPVVNTPATGSPELNDTTPTEGSAVTASTAGIADVDGLGAFTFQWQASNNGGVTWTNVGVSSDSFTPAQAQVNGVIRVIVSFTDGGGSLESVTSAASGVVGDLFVGNGQANVFNGTLGDDNANGAGGNDILTGNGGSDILNGAGGADTINAGGGADAVSGGAGADVLNAGGGSDTVNGGGGADIISANGGADTIAGGGGNDQIRLTAGFGNDLMTDFDAAPGGGGQDRLDLRPLGITAGSFGGNVTIAASPAGGTLVTVAGEGSIRLAGVNVGAVTQADFLLS